MAKELFEEKKSGNETLPEKRGETLPAAASVQDAFRQNFRAEDNLDSVENVTLPWIRVSRETKSFVCGEAMRKEFFGVVMHAERQNAHWSGTYKAGENALPDCWSRGPQGALVPDPSVEEPYHHRCGKPRDEDCCSMNQFGSATGPDGQPGKGKACKNTTVLMILVDDGKFEGSPQLLRLTPTSIRSWDQFASAARHEGVPFQQILARFSVTVANNTYGTALVVIEKARLLDFENENDLCILSAVVAKKQEYMADFRREAGKIERDEVDGEGDAF